MKPIVAYLLAAAAAIVMAAGCSRSADSGRLDRAAAVVETDPAAALAICDSIADPYSLPAADRARFGYVKSLAESMLQEPITDTTLLDFAIDYYTAWNHSDDERASACMFIKGNNLYQQSDYAASANLASEALVLLDDDGNDVWRGRLYRLMADNSERFLNYTKSLEYTDSAVAAFERAGLNAHAQYERINRASFLNGSTKGEKALAYLDSLFPADTEFYGDNHDVYYVAKAEIYARLDSGVQALRCIDSIADPGYFEPQSDFILTRIAAAAEAGRFEECDSLIGQLENVRRSGEFSVDDLNYHGTLYTVDKIKGNFPDALAHYEDAFRSTDSLLAAGQRANIEWYEGRLAVEKVEIQSLKQIILTGSILSVIIGVLIVIIICKNRKAKKRRAQISQHEEEMIRLSAVILDLRKAEIAHKEDAEAAITEIERAEAATADLLNGIVREISIKSGGTPTDKISGMIRRTFAGNDFQRIADKLESQCPALSQCLNDAGINEDDRKLLLLSKWGLTAMSIALIMNMTEHNVSVRKSRVKSKIENLGTEDSRAVIAFLWSPRR